MRLNTIKPAEGSNKARRRVGRGIGRGKHRHHLVAHGLDNPAAVLLGGAAHHPDADRHQVPCGLVTQRLVESCTADDIGKKDDKFRVFSHEWPDR